MLTEPEIRALYDGAQRVVASAMTEVTIDAHVVEAEQHCRAFAAVLEEKYTTPKRKE